MKDQTVFGSLVLCLDGSEQGLLSSQNLKHLFLRSAKTKTNKIENLNGGCRILCESHQRSTMRNQTRSHQLSHHHGEIRSDCVHAVAKIFSQLFAIRTNRNHLRAKLAKRKKERQKKSEIDKQDTKISVHLRNIAEIFCAQFSSHGNLGGLLQSSSSVLLPKTKKKNIF